MSGENAALQQAFTRVYTKFKLNFYKKIFSRFESREASLTAVETFCVEVIHALGSPSINEFAKFVNISQANAAYKVQSLINKGYIQKKRSDDDKREFFLTVTDKYSRYNSVSEDYVKKVLGKLPEQFTNAEVDLFKRMLETIADRLMPEVGL